MRTETASTAGLTGRMLTRMVVLTLAPPAGAGWIVGVLPAVAGLAALFLGLAVLAYYQPPLRLPIDILRFLFGVLFGAAVAVASHRALAAGQPLRLRLDWAVLSYAVAALPVLLTVRVLVHLSGLFSPGGAADLVVAPLVLPFILAVLYLVARLAAWPQALATGKPMRLGQAWRSGWDSALAGMTVLGVLLLAAAAGGTVLSQLASQLDARITSPMLARLFTALMLGVILMWVACIWRALAVGLSLLADHGVRQGRQR